MTDLQVYEQGDFALDFSQTTEISWSPQTDLSYDQWEQVGHTFQQLGRSLNWWLGDWLCYGDHKFGDIAPQAVEATGAAVESLLKYKAVADRIPVPIRRPDLSWTHHFYVAYIDPEQRGDMLELAARFGLSSRDLKDLVKLEPEVRADLIEQCEGVDDFATFRRILNGLRLASLDDHPTVNGDPASDEEVPFSSLEPDGVADDGASDEDTLDEVFRFWETRQVPLKVAQRTQAVWQGMRVVAAIDKLGNPVLRWERVP